MERLDGPVRIGLVHALEGSVAPARAAFAKGWAEAKTFGLLDKSLFNDLAFEGRLDDSILKRFEVLGDCASKSVGEGGQASAPAFHLLRIWADHRRRQGKT